MDQYLYHIKDVVQGFYRDRGSKFFSFAYPIHDQDAVQDVLSELKKKYYDARHHCYAYRLGIRGEVAFSTDDREPAHTAGPPILAAIRGREVTNVLVVVVRYFGGTKLGVRGLIEAYRSATEDALSHAVFELQIPKITFEVHFKYEQTSEINRIFHRFELEIVEATYTEYCMQIVAVEPQYFEAIQSLLNESGITVRNIQDSQ